MERVEKTDNIYLHISPEDPSDTLQIADGLYCVFNMSFQQKGVYSPDLYTPETAPEDDLYDMNFGKVSVFRDEQLIFERDSVLMVASVAYFPQYNKLIVPCVTEQNPDNLYTVTYFHLIDLETKSSRRFLAENSMQATLTDDGKYVIYTYFGDVIKYDIERKSFEYLFSFDPYFDPVVFNLSYRNKTLTLYLYKNWIEEYGMPLQKYTISDIEL